MITEENKIMKVEIDGKTYELTYYNIKNWSNWNDEHWQVGSLAYKKNGEWYNFSNNVKVTTAEEFFKPKSKARTFVGRQRKLQCWATPN